jgi:hypothetical protein
MAKYLVVVLLTLVTSILCRAQQKNKFPGLTQQDRKNYILSIDQHKIGKIRDTILFKEKRRFAHVVVRLSNNSNDTLNYIHMTCSWSDSFIIDNKNIDIQGWGCDSNFPKVYKIPPHKSSTFNIPLLFAKNLDKYNFRVGLYLLKYEKQHVLLSLFDNFLNSKASFKNFVIWSNEITIPKS